MDFVHVEPSDYVECNLKRKDKWKWTMPSQMTWNEITFDPE